MKVHKLIVLTNIILITFVTPRQSVCIHDKVQSKDVATKHINKSEDYGHEHRIVKREGKGGPGRPPPPMNRPGFQKIRIHCDYEDLDKELSPSQEDLLKTIIKDAVSIVQDIFSGNSFFFSFFFFVFRFN